MRLRARVSFSTGKCPPFTASAASPLTTFPQTHSALRSRSEDVEKFDNYSAARQRKNFFLAPILNMQKSKSWLRNRYAVLLISLSRILRNGPTLSVPSPSVLSNGWISWMPITWHFYSQRLREGGEKYRYGKCKMLGSAFIFERVKNEGS